MASTQDGGGQRGPTGFAYLALVSGVLHAGQCFSDSKSRHDKTADPADYSLALPKKPGCRGFKATERVLIELAKAELPTPSAARKGNDAE